MLAPGSCHQILKPEIDMSAAMGASYCDVVARVDLRGSTRDTPETQRNLYKLQQAEATCPRRETTGP